MKNVIITILVILVLGLGGYLVYDKVIDKDNNDNNEVTENNQNKEESKDTTLTEEDDIINIQNSNNDANISQKIVDDIKYYNYSKDIDKNMIEKYVLSANDYLEINESGAINLSYTTGDRGQIVNFENIDYSFYFKEGNTTYVIFSFNDNNKILIGKKEIFEDSYEFAATEVGPVANGGIMFEYKKVN